jgi:hypothetical protein
VPADRSTEDIARSERLLVVARNVIVDTATADAVRALGEAGVSSLLLRGPAIARRLYDSCDERAYADADLLVPPSAFDRARVVLAQLGFHESELELSFPRARPGHAQTWSRGSPPATIDLHVTIIGARASPARVWSALAERPEPMLLEGMEVSAPSVAGQATIVALHAAHHGFDFEQPLEDLGRALDRFSDEIWRKAAAVAEEIDAVPMFAGGLCLVPAGLRLAERLGLPSDPTRDRRLAGSRTFHVAQGLEWLADRPGLQAKTGFLVRKVFPAPHQMRVRSRLARRGPVGMGAAYAGRLAGLAVSAGPALVVFVRRRLAGR